MYPVVNVTWAHGVIALNFGRVLGQRLEGSSRIAAHAVRVRAGATRFVDPDLLVVCGAPRLIDAEDDTVDNPEVVIEVLSPSTQDYDYGTKFSLYRELPSLEESVLVSQAVARVEVFRRAKEDAWMLTRYEGNRAAMSIQCLSVSIPLSGIYTGVL